jgi:hypothetical protein
VGQGPGQPGERAESLERAIHSLAQALTVRTREASRQGNPADAYVDRIRGERAETESPGTTSADPGESVGKDPEQSTIAEGGVPISRSVLPDHLPYQGRNPEVQVDRR